MFSFSRWRHCQLHINIVSYIVLHKWNSNIVNDKVEFEWEMNSIEAENNDAKLRERQRERERDWVESWQAESSWMKQNTMDWYGIECFEAKRERQNAKAKRKTSSNQRQSSGDTHMKAKMTRCSRWLYILSFYAIYSFTHISREKTKAATTTSTTHTKKNYLHYC